MDSNGLYSSTSSTDAQQRLASFWNTMNEDINGVHDFKTQELPLARIKKIMKMDGEVKMISAEAPVLFAKAAEIFINELSLRAWIHTEDNKRRTLQRNDIAMAVAKYDQFDFLIDIVPRDELKPQKRTEGMGGVGSVGGVGSGAEIRAPSTDQVQYYFQLANPVSSTNSNSSPSIQNNPASAQQVAVAPPQSVQATPTLQLQPTQTVMQAVGLQQQQGTVSQSTNSMSQNATRTNTSTVESAVGGAASQQQGQPQQQQQQLYNMTTLRFNSQPINYNNRAPNTLQESTQQYQPSYSNQMSYLQGPQVYNSNQTSYQGNQQNRNNNNQD